MQSFSCLAPGDDEESGEAKEEQVRQEFEALGGEMKQRPRFFKHHAFAPVARSSD